jgi:integrase
MATKLTARSVEAVRPGAKRQEIPDAYLPGLYLLVQPAGAKSWAVRYRHAGASRKLTLGSYPALDLKTARELASVALRAVAEGRDPTQEKRAERERGAPDTIADLAEQFLNRHVRRNNRKRTIEATECILRRHVLPRWKNRLAASLTRRDVFDLLDAIVEDGTPIAANRTKTVLTTMFAWAVERDILAASPCTKVKKPSKETERDRVLTDTELVAVWKAADTLGGPYGAMVQLLALTGARRNEVAGMRWSETDVDVTAPFGQSSTWTVPKERAKNGQAHALPLSRACLEILNSQPRRGDLVLSNDGATAASNYSNMRKRLDALLPADMAPWRLHDLRRTLATGMARLGIAVPVVEKCLNHVSGSFGGIVGVYQHHDFAAEKRAAFESWARHVEELVGNKPAKVLPLRKA